MTKDIGPLLPATVQTFFVIGPYAALALVAWFTRSHRVMSFIVFACTLALAGFGVFAYYVEYDHFLNRDTTTPGGSNWMPFLVAVAQWFVTFCLALTLLPVFFYQQQKSKSESCITN